MLMINTAMRLRLIAIVALGCLVVASTATARSEPKVAFGGLLRPIAKCAKDKICRAWWKKRLNELKLDAFLNTADQWMDNAMREWKELRKKRQDERFARLKALLEKNDNSAAYRRAIAEEMRMIVLHARS